jgi:integrase
MIGSFPLGGDLPPLDEAMGWLLSLYSSAKDSAPSVSSSVTWDDFVAEICGIYRASRAPLTHGKLCQVLREFGEASGARSIRDLTPANVGLFVEACARRRRKPRTTQGLLAYLRAAANYAEARGYLTANPFRAWRDWGLGSVPVGDDDDGPKRHHSAEEIGRLIAHLSTGGRASFAKGRLHALVCLVAYTGLRRTEALTLQVIDCDLLGPSIRISRRRRLKRPTAAARVPLPEVLVPILERWIETLNTSECPYLFPNRCGGPWLHGQAGYRPIDHLRRAGEEVGIQRMTFQSLRHSWATHAESRWGLSELVIQRVLRHTRSQTQEHYRHRDLPNLTRAVAGIRYPEPSES